MASLDVAAGGAALAELAVSPVDGAEATEAVSTLGFGLDGVELRTGAGLEEVELGVLAVTAACGATAALAAGGTGRAGAELADRLGALFTVVVATFFDGVLAGLAGSAGGCDARGGLAAVLPVSATVAGLSRTAVADPTSAVGEFDAVVAGCTVVAG